MITYLARWLPRKRASCQWQWPLRGACRSCSNARLRGQRHARTACTFRRSPTHRCYKKRSMRTEKRREKLVVSISRLPKSKNKSESRATLLKHVNLVTQHRYFHQTPKRKQILPVQTESLFGGRNLDDLMQKVVVLQISLVVLHEVLEELSVLAQSVFDSFRQSIDSFAHGQRLENSCIDDDIRRGVNAANLVLSSLKR